MVLEQFKDPVCCLYLAASVVAALALTQGVTGLNNTLTFKYLLLLNSANQPILTLIVRSFSKCSLKFIGRSGSSSSAFYTRVRYTGLSHTPLKCPCINTRGGAFSTSYPCPVLFSSDLKVLLGLQAIYSFWFVSQHEASVQLVS